MHRAGILAAALLAALLTAGPPAAAADSVPGEIIVRFKGDAGGSERAAARRAARVETRRSMRLSGTQLVKVEPGQDTAAALAALRRDPRVRHAIRNDVYRKSATPDDPHFGSLWGLHNTGAAVNNVLGKLDADIDAPEAWDLFHSAPHTVVAVVDTGVRMDHPDLENNLWTDAAGRHGWDFVDSDDDPTDLDGHGTHVAGTIAAEGNNGIGISGVAWDARIMAVRVLDENGSGSGRAIADGFVYAAEKGARVVNASLGVQSDDLETKAFYDALFREFPETLFVVAAGNDDSDNDAKPVYPCNSTEPNVICVAATTNEDQLATDFSNFGKATVDLGAPGQTIRSTVPTTTQLGDLQTFDAGLPAGWSTAGSMGGSWTTAAPYAGYVSGNWLGEALTGGDSSFSMKETLVVASNRYDLSGRNGCVVAYDVRYELDAGKDRLVVESSRDDGATWFPRAAYTGASDGVEKVVTNLAADDASQVRFRFVVKADGTTGGRTNWFGALIDNVAVRCAVDGAESYASFRGTSMAAPHVAGAATLLFGARSDADVAQVRNWLLATGDPLPSLNNRTVTGRRLNVHSALLAAGLDAAVITGGVVDVEQTSATLLGTIKPGGVETSYQFVYGEPGGPTTTTPLAPAGSGTTAVAVAAPISGLSSEKTYEYQLIAVQNGTPVAGLKQTFRTAGVPAVRPPILTVHPATGVGDTVATVGGSVDPNGTPAGVVLEFGRQSGAYTSSTGELLVDTPSDVSADLTNLTPGTTYFYRLRATNADGESTSPEGSFTTTGTAPPAIPTPGGTVQSFNPAPVINPPPAPNVSVTCKLSKRKKVTCKAGTTARVKVSVLVMRGTKVFAKGSAARLVKGRALRMKTLKRTPRGRYTLRITVSQDGAIITTLKKRIRL